MMFRDSDLDDAPISPPAPMHADQARRLAQRIWGTLGGAKQIGRACVVGVRLSRGAHGLEQRGMGDTWERAFDAALANEGR